MRRARPTVLLAFGLAVGYGVAPRDARADEPSSPTAASVEEGRRFFRAAVEREDAGDFEGALPLYRQALTHAVSPQLLFNIASLEERLERLLAAASTYREA